MQRKKDQLEKSLAEIITMISMLETGVKKYPENTAFELSNLYRGLLKDAQHLKETCEKKIAELSENFSL